MIRTFIICLLVPLFSEAGNIRVAPLGALNNTLSIDLTLKVNDYITLGPLIHNSSSSDGSYDRSLAAFGLRLNYFPDTMPIDDGIYFGAEFRKGSYKVENSSTNLEGDFELTQISALAGYQWVWDNGFNINLAGGLLHNSGQDVELTNATATETYSSNELESVSFNGEFKIGYIF